MAIAQLVSCDFVCVLDGWDSSKREVFMKPYMGFSRCSGSREGACLVFAHSYIEARKYAHKILTSWSGDDNWFDTAVLLIRNSDHLFAEANQEKLAAGVPHVIECPKSCAHCETWGNPLFIDPNGELCCESCWDDEEFDTG